MQEKSRQLVLLGCRVWEVLFSYDRHNSGFDPVWVFQKLPEDSWLYKMETNLLRYHLYLLALNVNSLKYLKISHQVPMPPAYLLFNTPLTSAISTTCDFKFLHQQVTLLFILSSLSQSVMFGPNIPLSLPYHWFDQ